jgi:hypothetical protein
VLRSLATSLGKKTALQAQARARSMEALLNVWRRHPVARHATRACLGTNVVRAPVTRVHAKSSVGSVLQ